MRAAEIMTMEVVTVSPDTDIRDVAKKLFKHGVSAVPVVDAEQNVLGIISEGDLMRRRETGTERHPSWWLNILSDPKNSAEAYVKTHGQHAKDVMSRQVVTISEQTPASEIAELLERHRIKRVPVVRQHKLVGIVSRANLLHGLIAQKPSSKSHPSDGKIKKSILKEFQQTGVRRELINVVVSNGTAHLWGAVQSDVEKNALSIAAENTPGVEAIVNHISVMPQLVRGTLGGI